MEEIKLIDFIAGHLSDAERKEVLAWILESPTNKEKYYQLKNLWALSSQNNQNFEASVWDTKEFKKNITQQKQLNLNKKIKGILKYAAIITVAILVGKYSFYNPKEIKYEAVVYNEVIVPPGQMTQIILSDSTKISINSCSRLKYPSKFSPTERRVYLTGEAFFEVKKSQLPFIVESRGKQVKVLGTRFNIMAYPDDNFFQATLIEGKIELIDSINKTTVPLLPGDQYTYNTKRKTYSVEKVQTNLFDSWKDGIYVFDHITLEKLANRLERIYDVKIIISDSKITNYKFTGTISRNVQLAQILKIIQISAPVKYKIKEKHNAIIEVTLY